MLISYPFGTLSRRGLNPIKLVYGRLSLTAPLTNWVSLLAVLIAEFAVFPIRIASTHCAYPRGDGQVELAWVTRYITRRFTSPVGGEAPYAPSRRQRSSGFPRPTRSHAHRCSRLTRQHGGEQSGLVTLTFDLLTLKVVSQSRVTWAIIPLLTGLNVEQLR